MILSANVFASPGTLDSTFGSSGVALTNVSTADDEILAIASQPDNKIIVVGYSDKPAQFTIARYNTNGSLDTTFGTGGIVKTSFSSTSIARAVAIQADGKIVVGGDAGQVFALVRYTSSGQLDATFGNQGKVLTTIGNSSAINSIAIQSDGKIIAAGYTEKLGDFAVARYMTNGSLDTTFGGGDGIVVTDFYGDDDRATSVKLQADGKIVVGGKVVDFDLFTDFGLARYNSDGSPDTSFNGSGTVSTVTDCGINSLAVQTDGRIVVGGSLDDVVLARYGSDGSLDNTFGTNGIVTTNIGGSPDNAYSLTLDGSNGIILAGSTLSNGNEDFFVAKYSNAGVLDSSFDNGDGIVITSLGSNSDIGYAISLAPDGHIVVGGSQGDFGSKQFGVARYVGFQTTAANVTISGRVANSNGAGVSNVRISLSNSQGVIGYAITNSFGYYTLYDVPAGSTYILIPNSNRYTFTPTSRTLNLLDDYTGADFIAIE